MSLIVLEGLDGSGKGTQTRLLAEALAAGGEAVRQVTFPNYDSPSSALVKMYLAGEFGGTAGEVNAYAASSFYAVDRYASFHTIWKADYERGKTILADRYATSNIIYQLAKLPEGEWEAFIRWAEDFEYGKLGLPRPDRVLYLDMPVAVSQRLLTVRYHGDDEKKDIHERNLQFLKDCERCAHYAAKASGWTVISCARGEQPRPIEEIHRDVLDVLRRP